METNHREDPTQVQNQRIQDYIQVNSFQRIRMQLNVDINGFITNHLQVRVVEGRYLLRGQVADFDSFSHPLGTIGRLHDPEQGHQSDDAP
jgi:hypothetical protein